MRISVTISRSRMKRGSGVMSANTIPSTASGTAISPRLDRGRNSDHFHGGVKALEGVINSARQPPIHELEDVGQNLGHGAIEMRRNLLADLYGFVKRLRQGLVFDDGHLIFYAPLTNAKGQVVLALGNHQRRRHGLH